MQPQTTKAELKLTSGHSTPHSTQGSGSSDSEDHVCHCSGDYVSVALKWGSCTCVCVTAGGHHLTCATTMLYVPHAVHELHDLRSADPQVSAVHD